MSKASKQSCPSILGPQGSSPASLAIAHMLVWLPSTPGQLSIPTQDRQLFNTTLSNLRDDGKGASIMTVG